MPSPSTPPPERPTSDPVDPATPARDASQGGWFAQTAAPALGAGLLAALAALHEGARLPVGIVAGGAVAGVIIGMIALKRGLYGG